MPNDLETLKGLVEKTLTSLLPPPGEAPEDELYRAARYSLFGSGKRIRPLLALAVVSDFGGSVEQALLPASTLELVHTSSLVHDDLPCMDDDPMRRGKPSLHKAFKESTALLAGDFLLTYPFELLSSAPLPKEIVLQLIQALAKGIGGKGMIGGQILDLSSHTDLFLTHTMKTGALVQTSLHFGAILAGVDSASQKKISNFGAQIGLAFQITDDLLDGTAPEKTLGKNVHSDRKNGKETYLTLFGKEKCVQKIDALHRRAYPLIKGLPLLEQLTEKLLHRDR